jgi:Ca-activated chloride channel family protein
MKPHFPKSHSDGILKRVTSNRWTSAMGLATFLALTTAFLPTAADARKVDLDVSVGTPVMLANKANRAYVKVGLKGFALPERAERIPVNLSIVLDRSSSMSGEKIEKAKSAAIMALERLAPADTVSIVTYDSTVQVLVPATSARNKAAIAEQIASIRPGGSTALFAGVVKGLEEIRKFRSDETVNRIILISDGQANVGPSSPNELGRLGQSCAKEGISVTTVGLGLGYNEDLMTQLAQRSDGNHAFAESAQDLVAIFNFELGDVLSVVAQNVTLDMHFKDGVKPIRVLGRDAQIRGNTVSLAMNQLYADQEKFVLLEVEVPATSTGKELKAAVVTTRYRNLFSGKNDSLTKSAFIAFTHNAAQVAARENRGVMVAAVEAVATATNRLAVEARDRGDMDLAKDILLKNSVYLQKSATKYKSKKLKKKSDFNFEDANNLDEANWNKQRKTMRKRQYTDEMQQSY